MKPVYIFQRETYDEGDSIIAVYASEKEANKAMEDYMKENNCKNGTHIWYTVTGYRVRSYKLKE